MFNAITIGVLCLIYIIAGIFTITRKRWAKKQAKRMLDEGKVDMTVIERTLQLLAERGKDLEAQTLFRQVNNLAESRGQRRLRESKQPRWLRRFMFGFILTIATGVGVYGFVLLSVEQRDAPQLAEATRWIGVMLIGVAGIILFLMIRNAVKSWWASWLR